MIKKIATTLLACSVLATVLSSCGAHEHAYSSKIIQPTCKTIGYTMHVCDCGDAYYSDYKAETAHQFGEWQTGVVPTLIDGGEEHRICASCGVLQSRDVSNTSVLPKLYASTDGTFLYTGAELRFSCNGTLQSHTETDKRTY